MLILRKNEHYGNVCVGKTAKIGISAWLSD